MGRAGPPGYARWMSSAIIHSTVHVAPDADGNARLVVVSDTHSEPHPAVGARLKELGPAAILHAGDIGALSVLDALAAYAPVLAVRGNIDGYTPEVPEQRVIDVEGAWGGTLRLFLVHIAVYGPKLRGEIARAAHAVGAQVVVCGHSHVPFIGADKGLTVFNPGSIGPRRFSLPIVFGSIEIGPSGVRLQHRSCASGAPWWPGAPEIGA